MVTTPIGRTGHLVAKAVASGVAVMIGGVSLAQTTPNTIVVAVTGQPAPGTSEVYRDLSLPMLNNSGIVAFNSRLLNVPADFGLGLFAGPLDAPVLLAKTGDPVPAAGSAKTYGTPSILSVNDAGEVFIANNGVGSIPDPWVIGPAPDSHARVVGGLGRPAPGVPGATLNGGWAPRAASGGKAIFASGYEPVDTSLGFSGIWAGDVANPTLVARQHTRAPDLPSNYLYGYFNFISTEINSAGQIAYTANLVDEGNVQTPHGNALFSGMPSNPRLMMASGQRMPGPNEEYVSYVSAPRLTRSGKMAFLGHYGSQTDADGPSGGVFTADAGDPDSVRLIAASGEQVPGQAAGVIFRGGGGSGYLVEPFTSVQANAAGQVAFIGSMGRVESLDQTENEAVWLYTPGKGLKMIAREKDPAPGAGGGYEFRAYIPPSVSHDPVVQALALNGRGQVVFVGSYAEEADGPFAFGLWGTDAAGNLDLIAVPGQSIDLGNGDVRQLSAIHYYGDTSSEDGQPFAFNDLGQLAYRAIFADGSQAIVVTTVPEPTTFLLGAAGVAWLLVRRHRKWS